MCQERPGPRLWGVGKNRLAAVAVGYKCRWGRGKGRRRGKRETQLCCRLSSQNAPPHHPSDAHCRRLNGDHCTVPLQFYGRVYMTAGDCRPITTAVYKGRRVTRWRGMVAALHVEILFFCAACWVTYGRGSVPLRDSVLEAAYPHFVSCRIPQSLSGNRRTRQLRTWSELSCIPHALSRLHRFISASIPQISVTGNHNFASFGFQQHIWGPCCSPLEHLRTVRAPCSGSLVGLTSEYVACLSCGVGRSFCAEGRVHAPADGYRPTAVGIGPTSVSWLPIAGGHGALHIMWGHIASPPGPPPPPPAQGGLRPTVRWGSTSGVHPNRGVAPPAPPPPLAVSSVTP